MSCRQVPLFETIFYFAKRYGVALGALLLAGGIAGTLGNPAWKTVKKTMPELTAETLSEAAGTGIVLGTIGGFRTVLADIAWLRAYHFWSQENLRECEAVMALARTLDPQNYFFWEISVNYIAYDFPNWVVRARGGPLRVSEKVQTEIHRRAFEQAMDFFEKEAKQFPDDGRVWAHAAQVIILKTERVEGKADFERALDFYMRAMECKRQPWFTFLAYANIVNTRVPEKRAGAKKYLEMRLAKTNNPRFQNLLKDALAALDNG